MSERETTKPKLRVLDGGGTRELGATFTSEANLKVIPKLPNTSYLCVYTSNPIMLDMLKTFQDAHEFGCSNMDVYLNRNLGGLEFDPFGDRDENDPDVAPTTHPIFTFDLSIPFDDQFPISLIKSVKSLDDIIEAFEEIEFTSSDLPESAFIDTEQAEAMISQIIETNQSLPDYSEKIKLIKNIFDKQVQSATFKYLYIRLTDEGDLKPVISPVAMPILDADNFLRQANPYDNIIMSLDLTQDFDEQIRHSDIDLENIDNWYELVHRPYDGLMAIKLLEEHLESAPATLGPKGPVLAWNNPAFTL